MTIKPIHTSILFSCTLMYFPIKINVKKEKLYNIKLKKIVEYYKLTYINVIYICPRKNNDWQKQMNHPKKSICFTGCCI